MFNFSGKKNKTPHIIHNKTFRFCSWMEKQQKTRLDSQFCQRLLPLTCDVGVTWFNSLLCLGGLEHIACL